MTRPQPDRHVDLDTVLVDLRESTRRWYTRIMITTLPPIVLEDLNLEAAERRLCAEALNTSGSIVRAAEILGITRHALKRRIIKLRISWPRRPDTPE